VSVFDSAFNYVLGVEKGLSMDPKDAGNWTGGKVGVGQLKGTKYGISAAAFPDEDIPNLTVERAKSLAKTFYWDKVHGDEVPPYFGMVLLDTAYNQGVGVAVRALQHAVGVSADGDFGPKTMAALAAAQPAQALADMTTFRILSYSDDAGWPTFKNGWVARAVTTLRMCM
jgi:lysozyme family protein